MPKRRDIFAHHSGSSCIGELWVFCGSTTEYYEFLSLPHMHNCIMEKKSFDSAVTHAIIRKVERLPRAVYKTSKLQHKKNEEDLNNRREQPSSSCILDFEKSEWLVRQEREAPLID